MNKNSILRIIHTHFLVVVTALCGHEARADIGDGPRAYFPSPDGSLTLAGYGILMDGNQTFSPGRFFNKRDVTLETTLGVLQVTKTISMFNRSGGIAAIIPAGEIEADVNLNETTAVREKSSGSGDMTLLWAIGISGSPVLDLDEYKKHDPGFISGVVLKATLPTGKYSSSQSVNMGANRYAFTIMPGLYYYRGGSFLDPYLTTFELLPSATFFTDNNDNSTGTISQDPLYRVEAHVTQNVRRGIWLSADALYTYGGETETAGVSDDNKQDSLGLGATVGVSFNPRTSVKLSYESLVSGNSESAEGDFWRVTFSYVL